MRNACARICGTLRGTLYAFTGGRTLRFSYVVPPARLELARLAAADFESGRVSSNGAGFRPFRSASYPEKVTMQGWMMRNAFQRVGFSFAGLLR